MAMARPNTSAPSDGSRTVITTHSEDAHDDNGAGPSSVSGEVGILRLRGGPTTAPARPPRRRVVWTDDTVDNEGCGRKSSKICCIYHKPRKFDESSSEEDDSSSDDDSDSDADDARAAARRRLAQRQMERERAHMHGDGDCVHEHEHGVHAPNAYEKAPPSSSRKGMGRRKSG
ncbi:hypothetical protein MKEN_01001100 [Mycena kentingensis (nom. inval.)]|nr:hypothetical protein MKEN_01001100 [Mycena kentingensis (nom. inval.)]